MIMMFPTPHSPRIVNDGFDHPGDWNQRGPSMPRWESRMFTGPVAGLRMYTNARVAATGGASAGREKIVLKKPTPRRARASIVATPNAKRTCNGTMIAMIQRVFFTAPPTWESWVKRYL